MIVRADAGGRRRGHPRPRLRVRASTTSLGRRARSSSSTATRRSRGPSPAPGSGCSSARASSRRWAAPIWAQAATGGRLGIRVHPAGHPGRRDLGPARDGGPGGRAGLDGQGRRALEGERVDLLGVDAEVADRLGGLRSGQRAAAGQARQRGGGDVRRVDLEQRAQGLAGVAPPEAVGAQRDVVRRAASG